MKKKLLSLLLVLIMALSLLPTAVFAQMDPETCEHDWDDHFICKICHVADPDRHQHELGFYSLDSDAGHKAVCRWCGFVYGTLEEHTYNNTTDYRCTACGYIDYSRHIHTPGILWEPVDGDHHMRQCGVCGALFGDTQEHEYSERYICLVCDYVDPDRHVHEFGWYGEATDISSDDAPGHYEMCIHCGRPMSEVQHHNFERSCCKDCGAVSADHTHIYRDFCHNDRIERTCVLCHGGDQGGSKQVTHSYENGVCKDCGYLDPTMVPTSVKLAMNATKEITISLTFAGGCTMNLTVTDFEVIKGDENYSAGNFNTREGIVLGDMYYLIWNGGNRYSVAYDYEGTKKVVSNEVNTNLWFIVKDYAYTHGIALPDIRFVDGAWQLTGTGFDGKPNSMTITAAKADELFGHDLAFMVGVPETCGTAGSVEHYRCTVCGMCFTDADCTDILSSSDLVIPATGFHSYDKSGKCEACGFVNPLADVKKDDLKADTKNDKIITDGNGLTLRTEDPVTEDDLDYIKALVEVSAIRISVDDTVVSSIDQEKDGGLKALNDAVKSLGEDSPAAKELTQVAAALEKALKDTAKKNVQLQSVLDVSVDLIGDGVSMAQIIELPQPITVTAPISEELYAALQGKVVVILRSHTDAAGNVTTDELPATLGGEKGERYVFFQTDKASTFALVSYESTTTPTEPTTPTDPAVKTGDAGITLWLIALPVAALAAAAVVIGKKKSEAK